MKLSSNARNRLPDSDFGLSGRKYPMPDRRHAALALALAKLHHVPPAELAGIRRKAHRLFPGLNIAGLKPRTGN